jgi:hypothetical protein
MIQHVKTTIFQKLLKQKSSATFSITELRQKYRRFTHRNWITITTAFFSTGLCLFIFYMLLSPLPELPLPNFGSEQSAMTGTIQARITSSLDTYLEPLKTRDLFKPSVPIPAHEKIGKTTAEQLAQRLQFLGTSGEGQNLSALVFIPERGPGSFQVGDRVAEFVLKNIKKDSLVLELENERIMLKR